MTSSSTSAICVLTAPKIRIAGNGFRRRDGTFFFEGKGAQATYGAFAMSLDGRIERPKLAIRLARPIEALGLSDVLLNLDPTRGRLRLSRGGRLDARPVHLDTARSCCRRASRP